MRAPHPDPPPASRGEGVDTPAAADLARVDTRGAADLARMDTRGGAYLAPPPPAQRGEGQGGGLLRAGLLLIILAGSARAEVPPIAPGPLMAPPLALRHPLTGGGALWLVRDPAVPLASVVIAVRGAGSAADPPGARGLAAFTTDLVDEGTGQMGAAEVAERIERRGGSLRSWTDEDAAYLEVSTLSRALPEALALVAELAVRPALRDGDATRVRGQRLDLIRLRPDRPSVVATMLLWARLYGARSPYGHPGLGTADEVARLDAARARAFHAARWRPEAITVVVVGDFDEAVVRALLDERLRGWAAPVALPAAPEERGETGRLLVVDTPDSEQASVLLGARGISRNHPRAAAVEVMATLLGGTFGSRLNQRLREELGITYGASAWAAFLAGGGRVTIAADIVTAEGVRGLAEMLRIVRGLGERPVPAAELTRAKQSLVRSLPRAFDTHARTAETLAQLAVHGLGERWFDGYAATLDAVTARDVQRVARELRWVAVVVGDLTKLVGLDQVGFGPPVRHTPEGEEVR